MRVPVTHVAYIDCCFYDIGVIATEDKTPLAALLNRRGIRHTWLAHQLGISKFAMHRVLTGKNTAPDVLYARAAILLGVNVDEITPSEELSAA